MIFALKTMIPSQVSLFPPLFSLSKEKKRQKENLKVYAMKFPIADAHCDFLYGAMEYGYDINSLRRDQVIHLPYMQQGNVKMQLFACWYDAKLKTPPLQQGLTMVDCYNRMLKANPIFVPFTRDFDPNGDKIAAVLTIEGGEICEGSLAMLRIFKQLGVKTMTMTWNDNNELAGAAQARRQKGLTILGREMLREMNDIGVALDVSHLSDDGIRDALEFSTRPIFASHSNARALMNAPRCLPDDLIREIALQGGVIGVNFYGPHLAPKKTGLLLLRLRLRRHERLPQGPEEQLRLSRPLRSPS